MAGSSRWQRWGNVLITAGALLLVAAALAWFLLPVRYEAFALVQMSGTQPSVLDEEERVDKEAFDRFKRTQEQLVLSNPVLHSVLRDPGISRLETIEAHEEDPASWLRDELTVEYPGNAELMRISMYGTRPGDTVKIVNAVVDSYIEEIVEKNKNEQLARNDELRRAFEQHAAKHTALMKTLQTLAAVHGTQDSQEAQIKKRVATEQLDSLLARAREIAGRLDRNELEIHVEKALEAKAPETRTADPPAEEEAEKAEDKTANISSLRRLEVERQFLEEKRAELAKQIKAQSDSLAKLRDSAAEVTALQEEVEQSRLLKLELAAKLDRADLEERLAADRINKLDDAILENSEGDAVPRYAILGSVAALGLALLVTGIVFHRPPRRSAGD